MSACFLSDQNLSNVLTRKPNKQGTNRKPGINNPSLLNIVTGKAKGHRLVSPDVYLRPMMEKVSFMVKGVMLIVFR